MKLQIFRWNAPKLLSELDSKMNQLPDSLDMSFDNLKAISKGLNGIYETHIHDPKTSSMRNLYLVLNMKHNVYKDIVEYSPRRAVMFSWATKSCKLDICDLFLSVSKNKLQIT